MTNLSELDTLLETYLHFSLSKGSEKLIPYNNKNKPAAEQIEAIKARLNSPICPAGEYLIHCKNVLRNDVKPDVVIYNKMGELSEPELTKVSPDHKFEFEAFKLEFLNNEKQKLIDLLTSENKELIRINDELEKQIAELEEAEDLKETPGQSFALSEATMKPIESILQLLVPVFQPLLSTYQKRSDLKMRKELIEFNHIMRSRYKEPAAAGSQEPEPEPDTLNENDDMFMTALRELRNTDPTKYAEFVQQATTPPKDRDPSDEN